MYNMYYGFICLSLFTSLPTLLPARRCDEAVYITLFVRLQYMSRTNSTDRVVFTQRHFLTYATLCCKEIDVYTFKVRVLWTWKNFATARPRSTVAHVVNGLPTIVASLLRWASSFVYHAMGVTDSLFSQNVVELVFGYYARQHIYYSAYMPWQFRLSVRPSVTRVDQSKTVEARIT